MSSTEKIDRKLSHIADKGYAEMPIAEMQAIIRATMPDEAESERVWNPVAVAESLAQFAKLHGQSTGYVYVDRDRDLEANRTETAGVLAGGEFQRVPLDKVTLYILRTKSKGRHHAAWWPQIRFPSGRYAFAFAI